MNGKITISKEKRAEDSYQDLKRYLKWVNYMDTCIFRDRMFFYMQISYYEFPAAKTG